ncbi:MAG: hypothetical protein AAGU78_11295 [Chloroflexota bacterium]
MTKQEERWRQVFGAYDALRARTLGQVARWEWADGERYDPRPFYFERSKLRRGLPIPGPQGDLGGLWRYGFSADNRLVAARGYPARALHEDQCLEDFYLYGERLVESIRFAQYLPKIPIRVAHQARTQGQLDSYSAFSVELGPVLSDLTPDEALRQASAQNGIVQFEETYLYQGGPLARIKVRHEWGAAEPFTHEEELRYDKLGRVMSIEGHYPDGSTQTIYRRPEPSYGVGSHAGRIYQRLLEIIPQRLAQAKVRDKVYCLVLQYTAGRTLPRLVLGLERSRDTIAKQTSGAGARIALWQPSAPVFELEDPTTAGDRAILEQQLMLSGDTEPARELLCDVALALSEHKWKGVLNTTKDFVVFAANYAQDLPEDALAASVPEKRLAEFRRKGWL